MVQLFMRIVASVIILFLFFGCSRQAREESDIEPVVKDLAVGPDANTVIVSSDYVSAAVDATGGLTAWIRVTQLSLSCVVTLYEPDGSFYVTEQVHDVFPWSDSVRITASEPEAKFIWQLSGGRFSVLEGENKVNFWTVETGLETFARAMLDVTTAPVRFFDRKYEFTQRTKAVKIEGRFYWPIRRSLKTDGSKAAGDKAIFCQNQESFLFDVIWYGDAVSEGLLAVRAYNYSRVDDGILLPKSIEIFRASSDGVLLKLLAKIDYHW